MKQKRPEDKLFDRMPGQVQKLNDRARQERRENDRKTYWKQFGGPTNVRQP